MIALRERWTPTSQLFSRADEGQPRKFVADYGIAWQNYLDAQGVFREISLTPQLSDIAGYDWTVPGLPFKPYFALNGARRIFVDRNNQARRIDFPASKFLANKTFTKVGNSLVWSSNAYDVVMRWENSRIKFDVVVKRNIPFDQVQFDVDKTGLSDAELLAFMTNLKATDSSPEPIVRPLSVSLVAGVLTLGFDLTGMTFPVTIDPTLDLQVGASSDDIGVYNNGTSWVLGGLTLADMVAGYVASTAKKMGGGMRFLNVTIANAATIDVAYLTLTAYDTLSATTVNSYITGDDEDNAATWSTLADYQARRGTIVGGANNNYLTAAQVAWDNIAAWTVNVEYNSPSIVSIIQEIVNRAGWASGNALALWWDDHNGRGSQSDGKFREAWAYDGSAAKASKLHIEYTAGGAARRMAVIG